MPPYVVVLAVSAPWAAGVAAVMQTTGAPLLEALLPGAVLGIALQVVFLLLAPVLVLVAIPTLWAVVLLQAVATGFMSGLRSAPSRQPVDPTRE